MDGLERDSDSEDRNRDFDEEHESGQNGSHSILMAWKLTYQEWSLALQETVAEWALQHGCQLLNADITPSPERNSFRSTGVECPDEIAAEISDITPLSLEKADMTIFTHIVVGTNDIERARKFYDATLATLGIKRVMNLQTASLWGIEGPEFMVTKPGNGQPATHANGGTISFSAPNRAAVHKFHEIALANGAKDEGAPGPRNFTPTAYAAYVRDADGNKICTYCFAEH